MYLGSFGSFTSILGGSGQQLEKSRRNSSSFGAHSKNPNIVVQLIDDNFYYPATFGNYLETLLLTRELRI
jgi:hypothetical protein